MNWEAIGAIGEIVSAAAVIVSLVYVAIQIRQNTRMMRAAAKQNLTDSSQGVIYKLVEHSGVWVKLSNGTAPANEEEDARMGLLVRAILRGFEAQCYQWEAGLLEPDEWQALQNAILNICHLPGVHRYWLQLRPYMSKRLQSVVDVK
jgi:hypothetical protein